jgi:signal peptidase I
MLGDNIYGSQDSRYWGLVPEENIIGKAVLIFFSNGENGFLWKRLCERI